LGRHAELVEQAAQQRIVAGVVHDEPGVHVDRTVGKVDPHGVGVSAQAIVGLEERHVVGSPQEMQ
jgi:hypothetical protein